MGSEMLFSPQKQAKMKSNFTQTCNRFSHFLKERRSFGHLDAFRSIPSLEKEIKGVAKDVTPPKKMENERLCLELFPFMSSSMVAGLESSKKTKITSSELPRSKEEHNTTTTSPSMTIFYNGKVLVFDELPQDKAQQIMSLASSGKISPQAQAQAQTKTTHLTQNMIHQGASNLSELPIARRVSLHRFIEKRKHRIASIGAPYQIHNSSMMKSLYDKEELELKL